MTKTEFLRILLNEILIACQRAREFTHKGSNWAYAEQLHFDIYGRHSLEWWALKNPEKNLLTQCALWIEKETISIMDVSTIIDCAYRCEGINFSYLSHWHKEMPNIITVHNILKGFKED